MSRVVQFKVCVCVCVLSTTLLAGFLLPDLPGHAALPAPSSLLTTLVKDCMQCQLACQLRNLSIHTESILSCILPISGHGWHDTFLRNYYSSFLELQ